VSEAEERRYRPGVGLMLINEEGKIWIGERHDAPGAWQMPQGGIDEGESPTEAALRELHEEVGTDRARILAESGSWLRYDLPAALRSRVWGGKWKGQRQKWFALAYLGRDRDIDLDRHEQPEFQRWRWADIDELVGLAIDFKRPIYERVVEEFRHLAAPRR
jgi:putative (di)nucleoside polyphosphate hydrolase